MTSELIESSSRQGRGVLLILLRHLFSGDRSGATVDGGGGGGGGAEGKYANTPGPGRCQLCGAKVETTVIIFIVWCWYLWVRVRTTVGRKTRILSWFFPLIWSSFPCGNFPFSLRRSVSGAASVSPLFDISFETLCLVIIFSVN